jgi:hypothetical protein
MNIFSVAVGIAPDCQLPNTLEGEIHEPLERLRYKNKIDAEIMSTKLSAKKFNHSDSESFSERDNAMNVAAARLRHGRQHTRSLWSSMRKHLDDTARNL